MSIGTSLAQQSALQKTLGPEISRRLQINPASDLSGDYSNEYVGIMQCLNDLSKSLKAQKPLESMQPTLGILASELSAIRTYSKYVEESLLPMAIKEGAAHCKSSDFINKQNQAWVAKLDQFAEEASATLKDTPLGKTLDAQALFETIQKVFRVPLLINEQSASYALNPTASAQLIEFFRKHTLTKSA